MFRSGFTTILVFMLLAPLPALAVPGIVTLSSSYSVPETADRLEAVLVEKGMSIFSRIDHAAGAASVDKELRPTVLLIFGNPKIGTALMTCGQTTGIDLPLKALIWQDQKGQVKLSYNDPAWLAERHGIAQNCEGSLKKMSEALKGFAATATAQ